MTRDLTSVTVDDVLDGVLTSMREDGLNRVSSAELANASGYPRRMVDTALRLLEGDFVRREIEEGIGQPTRTLWYLIDA